MGVSVSVTLHRKNDDPEHKAKLHACRALMDAGQDELPKKLAEYFGCTDPEEAIEKAEEPVHHISVSYPNDRLKVAGVSWVDDDYSNIVELDLDKLPADLRIIRVRYG